MVQSTQQSANPYGDMSWTARIFVFLGVPIFFGLFGFALAYIEKIRDSEYEVDITRDFVWPWALGMGFVTIVGFRTGGFKRGVGERTVLRRATVPAPAPPAAARVGRDKKTK
ncbi:hypothetical protein ACHAXN_005059 [Cyclotella atomus]|jgi:hypothetical protein